MQNSLPVNLRATLVFVQLCASEKEFCWIKYSAKLFYLDINLRASISFHCGPEYLNAAKTPTPSTGLVAGVNS